MGRKAKAEEPAPPALGRYRLRAWIQGLHEGEPWPPVGSIVELPDDEAADMLVSGLIELVDDEGDPEEQEADRGGDVPSPVDAAGEQPDTAAAESEDAADGVGAEADADADGAEPAKPTRTPKIAKK